MLRMTQNSDLHLQIKRDVAIIFAINHSYSLDKTCDFLRELELPPLNIVPEDE